MPTIEKDQNDEEAEAKDMSVSPSKPKHSSAELQDSPPKEVTKRRRVKARCQDPQFQKAAASNPPEPSRRRASKAKPKTDDDKKDEDQENPTRAAASKPTSEDHAEEANEEAEVAKKKQDEAEAAKKKQDAKNKRKAKAQLALEKLVATLSTLAARQSC